MKVLVTGAAGFIGSTLLKCLSARGIAAMGIDSMDGSADMLLMEGRMRGCCVLPVSICDKEALDSLFEVERFDVVVNMAARAGVRRSVEQPYDYLDANVAGFLNVLEACRRFGVRHLVTASSSSVYGDVCGNRSVEGCATSSPSSFYAATKKAGEVMAYSYSHMYGLPVTVLRLFSVYGPWGRPDMAYFSFADKLVRGEKISMFNYGNCRRDFTYIDDIVEGVLRVMMAAPVGKAGEDGQSVPPYAVYNIGNSEPVNLLDFVRILSEELCAAGVLPEDFDLDSHIDLVPMQPGDVVETYADVSALERDFGFRPSTSLREGLRKFALWYKDWVSA